MLEVRVFKFNAKNDVLGYLKPHFYLNYDFATLGELLNDMQDSDPYLGLGEVKYVKVNGVVCDINAPLALLVNKFHNDLHITPLSEFEAKNDLEYTPNAFWSVYDEHFSALCDEADKASYALLEPYFYASPVREFVSDFVGDSSVIFAKKMAEKYPERKREFLRVISGRNGVWCAISLDEFMLSGSEVANEALEWAKANLQKPHLTRSIPHFDTENALPKDVKLSERFNEFDAVYYGREHSVSGLSLFEIKSANLPSGFDYLGLNDELAIGLASRILFDAFDSGADFLLVDNDRDFYMFDTLSRECEKHTNRKIENFYVLRVSELLALDGDWEAPELVKHKLKVLL
ncbi:hypothetical protein [Campylobacter sp. 19-13652]|uniref:HdrB C-terminal domain-containing protein n=1 Tax=Campylobacter sp. 19-13652 TaxID=2840180 RepID=UPI001C77DB7C|nr:hypothetical protein [Campylobacter sp. 19-13652]BCX79624.1 hypothetical protein LBC_10860 [Campylobacter sp. 19-13652]